MGAGGSTGLTALSHDLVCGSSGGGGLRRLGHRPWSLWATPIWPI